MGFTDGLKASWDKMQTQNKELHVSLQITSGKKFLNMSAFSNQITLRQNAEGNIYFDKVDGFFEITGYEWEGPRFKTVATTDTTSKTHEKSKKKGSIGGAVIGTMLMPGVGTAIGYASGGKKKKTGSIESNSVSSAEEVETDSNAKMTLRNLGTGESFTIGFLCNSNLDGELRNFGMSVRATTVEEITQQKSKVELMKEYKDLLDAGIISEEEFAQKKKEILGI